MRSFFVTIFAFLTYLLLFPLSLIIYSYVFKVSIISNALAFAIFVGLIPMMLNLYVLFNAWEESGHFWFFYETKERPRLYINSLAKRMTYTLRIGGRIILVSNTAQFFIYLTLALKSSLPLPIQIFGIFCSIVLFWNLILGLFYLPCLLVIHERFIRCDICCCKYKNILETQKSQEPGFFDRHVLSDLFLKVLRVVRWPLVIGPIAWGIAACVLAVRLEPMQHLEHFFPHEHWVTYRIEVFYNLF